MDNTTGTMSLKLTQESATDLVKRRAYATSGRSRPEVAGWSRVSPVEKALTSRHFGGFVFQWVALEVVTRKRTRKVAILRGEPARKPPRMPCAFHGS